MLNELECVWTALFGECVTPGLRHNEHILNSSIASEFSSTDNDGISSRNEDAKLYSLKRVLQVALDNADPELTEVAVEAVFKAREELVNVFKNVAQEQGFNETLRDAIKLITIDALNRKVKERNVDLAPSMTDIGNVKAVRGYFEKATELKQLLKAIKQVDSDIARVQRDIQQVTRLPCCVINVQDRATLEKVEEYMNALQSQE
ncbi:transcriptional coactivator pterin dehydratase, putative [Babesia ovata]|uniref:Transcriptional coactivator pterin dehydratase, putative n=1 Tax=Babesia ovata TaxID=189622 RepID=A0A2H6KH12_9APIC|nr:transcriptional coactivator pterin dehydratase, putative [Babesia ovata]GBE62259.1 transcriptional coactivator pterin dehydratase, putative [Babesia ovata]